MRPKNIPLKMQLEPGETYEKTLSLHLAPHRDARIEALRMAFTPTGEVKKHWSNEVVMVRD
jgi:hypothetical protein